MEVIWLLFLQKKCKDQLETTNLTIPTSASTWLKYVAIVYKEKHMNKDVEYTWHET